MKFGRYLQDTQIPEWKKKYIDYRGLKKHINAIQQEREENRSRKSGSLKSSHHSPLNAFNITPKSQRPRAATSAASFPSASLGTSPRSPPPRSPNPRSEREGALLGSSQSPQKNYGAQGLTPPLSGMVKRSPSVRLALPAGPSREPLDDFSLPPPAQSFTDEPEEEPERVIIATGADTAPSRPRLFTLSFRRSHTTFPESNKATFESYRQLLEGVTQLERKFFDYLDQQVDKAEGFYNERYREAAVRMTALKEQFKELQDHRRAYHAAHSVKTWKWKPLPYVPKLPVHAAEVVVNSVTRRIASGKDVVDEVVAQTHDPHLPTPFHRNPETYHGAKKDLKHAVIEFHRFLELLKDFQALNVTAIRKSIKKFEKTTGMRVRDVYNKERVDPLSISSDKDVKAMIDEVEKMYASRFEGGDMKKARNRLRADPSSRMHHVSTFRSGLMLGLSIPALVVGTYQALLPARQEQLPIWWALLDVYATLGIPTLFSLLVGINIAIWAKWRLNYVFIFGLDVRTAIDCRVYFETPAFLFLTLSYAYMLSFTGIFEPHISATAWPLVWIVLFLVTLVDPLPIMHLTSRFWLLKNWAKLVTPGFYPVDFADFWMGDQLCSMVYTLGHLYFMGCVYATHWDNPSGTCSLPTNWVQGIILTSLPSFIRFVQCIKRYVDSHNYIHLINAGKYSSSIVAYGFFFNWRSNGSKHDHTYIAWIFFSTVMSAYSAAWDILMDWSLFSRKAIHPFLRPELIYGDIYPVYYFAMFSNILIRFAWIIYAPSGPLNFRIRSAAAALLEVLRRFQWNFFRVENEHLGNADQYRVTREVPLPYSFDHAEPQNDSDDDESDRRTIQSIDGNEDGVPSRETYVPPSGDLRSVRMAQVVNESPEQIPGVAP